MMARNMQGNPDATNSSGPIVNSASNNSWNSRAPLSQLASSLGYEASAPIAQVQQDIHCIREFDKIQEKRAAFWAFIIAAGFLGLGLAIVCFILEMGTLGIVCGAAGIATVVFAIIKRVAASRVNLENSRYELLEGLLQMLGKDMASEAEVKVQMDFRPHNHKSKLQGKGKVGYWNAKFYADRWFDLSGRFLDGTKYSVTLIDKQQDRSRTKTSASGKLKSKHKTKIGCETILTLKVKPGRYPRLEDVAKDAKKQIKLPGQAIIKSIHHDAETLSLRVKSPTRWQTDDSRQSKTPKGVHLIAMMFLGLYQTLNIAKAK